MAVRVPLDVDLEDRLVFGLSPQRFGYVVLAALLVLAIWSQHWLWIPLRVAGCIPWAAGGAAFAWGRWRGRALDDLAYDGATFLLANYRLDFKLPRPRPRFLGSKPASPPTGQAAQPDPLSICLSPGLDSEVWAA